MLDEKNVSCAEDRAMQSQFCSIAGHRCERSRRSRLATERGVFSRISLVCFCCRGTSEKNGYIRRAADPIVKARGGIIVKGTGHAEVDVVAHAKAQGWTLIAVGATRPICDSCAADIASAGATAATP